MLETPTLAGLIGLALVLIAHRSIHAPGASDAKQRAWVGVSLATVGIVQLIVAAWQWSHGTATPASLLYQLLIGAGALTAAAAQVHGRAHRVDLLGWGLMATGCAIGIIVMSSGMVSAPER